jgi:ribosomal protein S27AE
MPRPQNQSLASSQVRVPIARQNLDYCGFECPRCGYQHRLSDRISNGVPLAEVFRSDATAHAVICPECGISTVFARSNLKLFRGRGEE